MSQTPHPHFRRTCTELLQGSINGKETRGADFHLRLRGRRRQKVLLNVSMRTDVAGAVSGAICVLFPLGEPVSDPDCKPLDGVNEDLDLAPEADLGRTQISLFRTDSDSSLTVDTIAADCETPTVKKWEGGFSFGLDRVQNSPNSLISSRCSFGSIDGASSLDLDDCGEQRLRALVVDEVAANRELLTALLERCGFDVACASSTKQAAWRFEQAQRERRGFRVVFIELMMAADER
jgi:CheY-like chemotaxis protein